MVTETIATHDEDELVTVKRELREAKAQLDQASASGNLYESLQSMISYIQANDLDDAFLGHVGDEDTSKWIVIYAPAAPGAETENGKSNNMEMERNTPQASCCTII